MKTAKRKSLKPSQFALSGQKKDAHAANAKARASQQEKKGNLSPASLASINAKANRVLYGSKGKKS